MRTHPAVRSQQFKVSAATAEVDVAEQAYWPTPSISIDRSISGLSSAQYDGDTTVATFRLEQPLWTAGRLSAGVSSAEARQQLANSSVEQTQQTLMIEVLQGWSDWLAASEKINAVQASKATHMRLLDMVQRRTNEGMSARADVALAQSRIGLLSAQLQLLEAQRNQALEKLSSLVGFNVASLKLSTTLALPTFASTPLDTLLQAAQQRHPEVAAARHQAEVARAESKRNKADLYPQVSIRFEHQTGSFTVADRANENQVLLSVTSSFGPGFSRFSQVDRAAAQYQAALQDIQTQQQRIAEQVRSDWTLWQAAKLRIDSLAAATEASAAVLDSYERQFLAGRKQWLDLMNAAREQAQSASEVADAQAALALSAMRLQLLSAGPQALLSQLRQQGSGL